MVFKDRDHGARLPDSNAALPLTSLGTLTSPPQVPLSSSGTAFDNKHSSGGDTYIILSSESAYIEFSIDVVTVQF